MKGIKLYLLFMLAAVSSEGFAQQININVNAVPASVEQGKTGYIEVSICNVDVSPITAPANKLRPLISVPGNVTITGVTDVNGNELTGFNVLSLTPGNGNSIRLLATQPLPNFECFDFHVTIEGVNIGPTDVITGTLGFQGPPTTNDVPADNNATTGIEVTTPLPVTLVSFNAAKEGNTANLRWATTEETNSDRFEIERSSNAKNWAKIGTVKSSGESKVLKSYAFTDANPLSGTNYYRLKMVDVDNTFAYSQIRNVEFGNVDELVSLYPNPASEELHVRIKDWTTVSSVKLRDINGRVVRQAQDATPMDIKSLAPGLYVVQVTGTDGISNSHKITIAR